MLLILWAALTAYNNYEETSDQHCAIIGSTSNEFAIFHFLFLILAYVVSFTSLVVVYCVQRRNRNIKKVKRNSGPRIQTYIVLTGLDVILVTIPGVTMLGAKFGWWTPNDIIISLTYSTTGLLSLVHIGFNLVFQKNFKSRVLGCYRRVVISKGDETTHAVGAAPATILQVSRTTSKTI
uniref:G_PROTEIN_RECEP_F1_2 domain-containing protein n=1 Tax=Bursaphelenchus xylophilus TaxID=6326 RepID=A0A1I7RJT1_BURXY